MACQNIHDLRQAFQEYGVARRALMSKLGCPNSNRDPVAEFSERLVACLVGGQLANSVVQKDYDVIEPTGEKIQVKSLSNSIRAWKNGHEVSFEQCRDADSYALVIFEDAALKAILIFPKCTIKDVYKALKKRHAKPDSTLQFMQANLHTILGDRETFQGLGMRIFDFATDSMTHCP